MRVVSLRSLARVAPDLDEAVLVSHRGQVIGRFVPGAGEVAEKPASVAPVGPEPQSAAASKSHATGHAFGRSSPAPKPGAGRL